MLTLQRFATAVLLVLHWVGIHSLQAQHISPACSQGKCLWSTELMLLALLRVLALISAPGCARGPAQKLMEGRTGL